MILLKKILHICFLKIWCKISADDHRTVDHKIQVTDCKGKVVKIVSPDLCEIQSMCLMQEVKNSLTGIPEVAFRAFAEQ